MMQARVMKRVQGIPIILPPFILPGKLHWAGSKWPRARTSRRHDFPLGIKQLRKAGGGFDTDQSDACFRRGSRDKHPRRVQSQARG